MMAVRKFARVPASMPAWLGVSMPSEAWSDERSRFRVNPIPASDLQENSLVAPAMGPPAPTGG